MKRASFAALCLIAFFSGPSAAWDPIGDITHPERIVRNVGRELDNAGREVDRIRLEAQAQAGAPAFEQWLNQSRSNASNGAAPVPAHIRQQLQGFYDNDILNRARFKIGDGGVFNLANLSIQYGGAAAVTLVDVIVFQNAGDAYNNAALWAHELKHVQQFRDWGVRDFAIRYLRSWNGVEGEAYAAENSYQSWSSQMAQRSAPQSTPTAMAQSAVARVCATNLGVCGMGVAIPVGSQCYCPTFNGPIWGVAR
ncbi:eCIS core domain-containing protein [Roseateles sp. P5_E4]